LRGGTISKVLKIYRGTPRKGSEKKEKSLSLEGILSKDLFLTRESSKGEITKRKESAGKKSEPRDETLPIKSSSSLRKERRGPIRSYRKETLDLLDGEWRGVDLKILLSLNYETYRGTSYTSGRQERV